MSSRILHLLAALACAVALTAGTASAHGGHSTVIVFTVQNLGDGSSACPSSLFGLSFDMASPRGSLLGAGVSCVDSIEGCQFAAGCRTTVGATFTLDFGRGSLTAPVVLTERWLTDTTLLQFTNGTIVAGTGDFAGAAGSINCVGVIRFTETAVIPRIVCVVRVR